MTQPPMKPDAPSRGSTPLTTMPSEQSKSRDRGTTTTLVARVPYLNSAPFFRGLTLGERYTLSDCVPRRLGEQAAAGEIAAGLLPLIDYVRLEGTFERLGHFGIAVRGRARSVLLFTRKPLRQLEGATIAVTEETSSSACLLQLILEQRYKVTPASHQRGTSAEADALLLIGDEALRFKQTNTRYPFEIDIAFEWWLWQHLPFVFAVWAIRKDASAQEKKQIESGIARSLGMNLLQLGSIAAEFSQQLGISAEELETYLSNFVYRLGQFEEEGIKRFKELVDECHLL